ncbi:hypothetical protein E4T56_gene11573 [Termitomyces sp. T112]|nr:hypothetical protein E4T56_gene11573 [Termitomyces sp. T112]
MRPGECQLLESYASERSLSEEARTIELETSILLARARKLVRKRHFENQLTAKLFLSSEKGSSTFGGTFFGKAITITPNNTTGPSTSPSTASGGQTRSVFGGLSSRVGLANTFNTASNGSQTGSAFADFTSGSDLFSGSGRSAFSGGQTSSSPSGNSHFGKSIDDEFDPKMVEDVIHEVFSLEFHA